MDQRFGSKQLQPSFPEKCQGKHCPWQDYILALKKKKKKAPRKFQNIWLLLMKEIDFSFPILKQMWDIRDCYFFKEMKYKCQKLNYSGQRKCSMTGGQNIS